MKIQRTLMLAIALILVVLTAASCGKGNSSPSKAFQTLYEGMKNNDLQAMKSVMSKTSLDEGQKAAQRMNKSSDDMLKEGLSRIDKPLSDKLPELRNETIASGGKTATLEVKDPLGKERWEQIHFTKEDDGWKVDFGR